MQGKEIRRCRLSNIRHVYVTHVQTLYRLKVGSNKGGAARRTPLHEDLARQRFLLM